MSEVKVNKISPRSGTEVTLGDSGDTFTIPSGATINNQGTATNFGATGSASWNTTVKTSTFTAVAGEGYFVNTTGGVVSVNLPAGTAGAVVAIKDYAGTFDTNKVTLVQNGSDKIGGSAVNATLDVEGIAVTLVFIDSTQGWLVTDSGLQTEAPTASYITATGGTITTVCTNFKVHTFTGPGTFTVCTAGNAAGSNSVDYLVVAGGGGGGNYYGAGGGAGGVRASSGTASGCYTAGPLAACVAAITVTAQGYPIVVGGGGPSGTVTVPIGTSNGKLGTKGSNSSALGITSTGGGFGAGVDGGGVDGGPGGSGGGAAASSGNACGGAGNAPPVSPAQGKNGGPATSGTGSGGGGATVAGATNGPGGNGLNNMINPATGDIRSSVSYYGGGGNSSAVPVPSYGNPAQPLGGGGGGSNPGSTGNGVANTGGGAGGNSVPGNAGSGIVVIRYKFQN